MNKEWIGGLLVEPDFKKDELFLYKHSTLIANTLSKGYDIPVNSVLFFLILNGVQI